jgi:hypothetical protein
MDVLLANDSLADPGGTETYLVTIAESLTQLGHRATLHARNGGIVSEMAAGRGLEVALEERELPSAPHAILVQDAAMSYDLADRYPGVPQVFRAASGIWEFGDPPQLPGIVNAVLVLNDRLAEHVQVLGEKPRRVVRLRQPVDTLRLTVTGSLPERPRRAVMLGNYLRAARQEALVSALEEAGIEYVAIGRFGVIDPEPMAALASAEIVFAKGRAALDAMSCGRAVYVYDQFGNDGWVTPETYPALESDGFAGASTDRVIDPSELAEDLRGYSPGMGAWNREIVLKRHAATRHARALVSLLEEEAARAGQHPPPGTPLREMARLVRSQWRTEGDTIAARMTLEVRTEEVHEARRRAEAAEAEVARLREALATKRARAGLRLGRILDRLRRR